MNSPPRGMARGLERPHGLSGGVGGALGIGEREKRFLQRHPVINKIDAKASIWHIFLAVLNTPHFASETEKFAVSASLRSAQSVAREWRWASPAGGKSQNKSPEALDSNHATNFEPCGSRRQNFKGNSAPFRAFGAQGGAFGYRRGSQRKKPRLLAWFPLAPPAGLEPATR